MLEIVAAGLSTIASVSTLVRNLSGTQRAVDQVNRVEILVEALRAEIRRQALDPNESRLLDSYQFLLASIRLSDAHRAVLQIRPTEHGTYVLVARRKRPTMLRDPKGEFGLAVDGQPQTR